MRFSVHGKFAGCANYPECTYTRDLSVQGERPVVEETEYVCPKCGQPLLLRTGKRGRFFGCSGYPECTYAADVGEDGAPSERKQPVATEEKCPECGEGVLIVREGRRGKFLGCSRFPRCRYTRDYGGEPVVGAATEILERHAPAEDGATEDDRVPVVCDECGAPMKVRSSKRGRFLGCTRYPACRATKPISAHRRGLERRRSSWANLPGMRPGPGAALGRRGKFVVCSGYRSAVTRDYQATEEGAQAD